jgi:hypothetical protein
VQLREAVLSMDRYLEAVMSTNSYIEVKVVRAWSFFLAFYSTEVCSNYVHFGLSIGQVKHIELNSALRRKRLLQLGITFLDFHCPRELDLDRLLNT